MEKRRRAEKLISFLRWLVVILGLAAIYDEMSLARTAAVLGSVVLYNGAMAFIASDAVRFMQHGRRLSLVCRAMDAVIITLLTASSGQESSHAYVLYWFVLVAYSYATSDFRKLLTATGALLVMDAGATIYSLHSINSVSQMLIQLGLRSGVIAFGFLISAYIAKVRSQDELAADRGSYLHAIMDCGARLTSFRNAHDLAMYVLESAVTETSACGGELLMMDPDSQQLECEAFYSASGASQETDAPSNSLLCSYAHWVVNSGREFMVRTGGKAGTEEEGLERDDRPAMAVPLLWQASGSEGDTSVLGVLIVWGYEAEDFGEDALDILRIFAAIAGAAIVNLRLYTGLQKSFLRTLQSLANGLEARDEYTRGHSDRVMQASCLIAEELGVPPESVDSLRNAALLHDIGKIGVPDSILRKAGKLSVDEWEVMRKHPIVSEEICRPLGLAQEVLFLIKHHQERLDGKGYPAGLPPSEQPLLLRILVVADSFDAMRSRRPYRDRMPQEELLNELNRCAGTSLDPTVVDALKRRMDRGDMDALYEEQDRLIDGCVRSMKVTRKAA